MADLKINQLDPIINPLQDNDLFVVKMKIRGTAIADEDRKVSWLEVKQALNLTQYMPTNGGDFTGAVRLGNNVALNGKSTTNSSLQIAKVNASNNIEIGNITSQLTVFAPSVPQYNDGSSSFDFITRKNLPTPGDINTYTKAEIDTKDAAKLNLTGGNVTGNVRFNNNRAVQGLTTTSTTVNMLMVTTTNDISVGATTQSLILNSNVAPVWKNASGTYDVITQNNLPSPGDIGAYTKGEVDTRTLQLRGDLGTIDLNTLDGDSEGFYYQTRNSNATPAKNYPAAYAGNLRVHKTGVNNSKSCIQYYDLWDRDISYRRTGVSDTGGVITWSDWAEVGANAASKQMASLGIGSSANFVSALDWQTFDFVPGALYAVVSGNMTNVPPGLTVPGPTYNTLIRVSGPEIGTRHVEVIYSTVTAANYLYYQVRVAGNVGARSFTVRQIFTSSDIVPVANGGTGGATPQAARTAMGFDALGIGLNAIPTLASFDWQQADLYSAGIYRVASENMTNAPSGVSYTSGTGVFIKVDGASAGGQRYSVEVVPDTSTDTNYKIFKVLVVGAKGSRTFSVRQTFTNTDVVPVENGGTGANSLATAPFARKGINSDITALNALTGALKVGANATQPLEVTTLQQVQAMTSGTAGAVVGVVGGFIGAVMWFNGTDRSKIPSGWVAADGQTLLKADYPDLWAAVNNGSLFAVTEAAWQAQAAARGAYAKDTSATTFRVMDLNGEQAGSVGGLFLRGHSTALNGQVGGVATISLNAAPNITGTFPANAWAAMGGASGAFTLGTPAISIPVGSGSTVANYLSFNAALSHAAYGRNSSEVRPNSVVGIWIIRATNSYAAANTSFTVYNGNPTAPAAGTALYGGDLVSMYQQGGISSFSGGLRAFGVQGGQRWTEFFSVDYNTQERGIVKLFAATGDMLLQPNAGLSYSDLNGTPYNLIKASVPSNVPTITIGTGNEGVILVRPKGGVNGSLEVRSDANVAAPTGADPGWSVLRTGDHSANKWWSQADGGVANKTLVGGGLISNLNIAGVAIPSTRLYHRRIVGQSDNGILEVSNGSSAVQFSFATNGNAAAPGTWQSGSDIRHKTNIRRVENALDVVLNVNGYIYDKKDGGTEVGFIAQEAEKYCPEAVSSQRREFNDGTVIEDFKYLNVAGFGVAYAFEAIKTLKGIIDDLNKRIKDLESSK